MIGSKGRRQITVDGEIYHYSIGKTNTAVCCVRTNSTLVQPSYLAFPFYSQKDWENGNASVQTKEVAEYIRLNCSWLANTRHTEPVKEK